MAEQFMAEFEGMTVKKDGTRILKFSTDAHVETDDMVGGVLVTVDANQLRLDGKRGQAA